MKQTKQDSTINAGYKQSFHTPLIILLCVLAALPTHIRATEQSVRFGVMALTPYVFYDEEGTPQGNLYNIAKAITKEGNFHRNVDIEPIKRLGNSILTKQVLDCSLFGDVPNIRNNYTLIESTGIDVDFGILPRKGIHITDYSDLSNIRIGVPLGISIGHPFDTDDSLNKVQAKNYRSGMLMLKHNRFDALAGVISSLQYAGRENGVTAESYGEPYITKRIPIWVVCRPNFASDALARKIRTAVITLRENGTIAKIFREVRQTN